ncbi:hypothetical protein FE840_015865 [Peteryoungia desertarenae]|uniref:Uncharacterized protein n=1 Tax=Peteryoungia desertarenae TaxID=1813451 RepID=A0ABX6QQI3_9HYPH|nr:hypothetical protein [Peteryoungia desertarenae]QLF70901.1 hypothetical protein FE840_015865 [Peteryoungia desertarenae]
MTGILRKAGIAALVSLMAVTGVAPTASADSFGWGVYIGGGGPHIEFRDGPRHWDRHGDRHRDRHDDRRWDRHDDRRARGECRPHDAIEKARWTGLRRARIHDVTPRRVVISGFRHGDFDRMVFANVRGCPVIRY